MHNLMHEYFKSETDLHMAVVKFIKENYPSAILVAGLGEYQNTEDLRLECWKKRFRKGQPDLMILNKISTTQPLPLNSRLQKVLVNYQFSRGDILPDCVSKAEKNTHRASSEFIEIIIEITKYFEWCKEDMWCQAQELHYMMEDIDEEKE